tara:strand:+ start:1300 stop:1641 length:342 start_codon:yes stop_codon:yes gene_type:complete
MVTFKYKGNRTRFVRTDGGRVIAFGSGQVYDLDENDKRSKELVKKLLAFPEDFEVQRDVGTKKVGAGVRTGSKALGTKQEKVDCPKGSYKCKGVCKCGDLKKPKGLKKSKRAD